MAAFVERVRSFAKEHLLGKESQLDALPPVPGPLHQMFGDMGLANWWVPKQFGGRGITLEESVDIVVELAYADAGFSFTSFVSVIGSSLLSLYGTPELKARYLTAMAETGTFGATLGSEREAGSELTRMTTQAVLEGDSYRLSGRKFFSTNAEFADYQVCIAAAPNESRGYVALVIPKGAPGVVIERRWKVNGVRSSGTYEVRFENVRVPARDALPGNGLRLLEIGLNPSRTLIAATAIGIGRRMRDLCVQYAQEKPLKGSTLLRNPVFAAKLGQMEMELEAMRAVCRTAAREYDTVLASPDGAAELERTGSLKSVMVAKMLCGQLGWNIASVASQMFGGLGYTEDSLIGKLVRDIRYVSLLEGGDDVLREVLFNKYVLPQSGG